MAWCLAQPLRAEADGRGGERGEHRATSTIHRFDPRFWTVNFPRPMMAAITSTAADALRVDLAFTGRNALAGLIWEAEDKYDHPLTAYQTDRDFRRCTLSFRWRASGVKPLDAVHGPTLTIEGRDESGAPRAWYVRLWNYASGTPDDALVTLDFATLDGGFLLPAEADRVWAGDVDRMLITLVPPDYDGTAQDYAAMAEGWAELSAIRCGGSGAVLTIGDAMLPGHGLSIATAYDDSYNLTPARLARMVEALGYSGPLLHYVGMSHYPRLSQSGGVWQVTVTGGILCGPALVWHQALAAEAKLRGWTIIWSFSYELFAAYCPAHWAQRSADGAMAQTGWVPPSTLLSPAVAEGMGYLALLARALVGIARDAAMPVAIQIGEPWWWIASERRPCLYDAATTAALGSISVPIPDLSAPLSPAQKAMLDAAGAMLASSTAALNAAIRDEAAGAGATTHLLIYLPTLLDPLMPELYRANLPTGWASPAFDILQLEDYDWAARGQSGASAAGVAAAEARLAYPVDRQHYLAGFVLRPEDVAQWAGIDAAANAAAARGVATRFIWALPQVARDGFTRFGDDVLQGDDAVRPFDDTDFPLSIGAQASVLAEFSTAIVTGQSGAEQRSPDWANARLSYDAGPGVRSEDDVRTLIDFYRARRGPAIGFRFRDPFDASSAADGGAPAATDQLLGNGDGIRTDFPLVKQYGSGDSAVMRRITRPVTGTLAISINGAAAPAGWTLADGGIISFAIPPAAGAAVRAGFLFDVPVRFAADSLEQSRATYMAGDIPSVPLIEVREG